ncbi:MAG: hypothetical protein J1E37_01790 [Prevotella sp.]|nr:hypothetical protein [Prevotella sp.]
MKRLLKSILVTAMLLAGVIVTNAQSSDQQVLLKFHTQHYDLHGEVNSFQFVIGATEDIWVDVDCGYGPVELEVGKAVYDEERQSIVGTVFTGSVSAAGDVVIYGDASKIDYLDLSGMYITELQCDKLVNLDVLNLEHNELLSLDLSHMTKLQALYLDDNPFTNSPLVVGANKPNLTILSMSIIGRLDSSFNFSDYPSLVSAMAWNVPDLTTCDVSNCPELIQLSIDATNVSLLDISKNPKLRILNISETRITNIDLSSSPNLTEFYAMHIGSMNNSYKLQNVDLSNNVNLIRLFLSGNDLDDVDVSMLPNLETLNVAHNNLTSINIDSNPYLVSLDISMNKMDFSTIPDERDTFIEYNYMQQNLPVDFSYKEGTVLDFSAQTIRPNSQTDAVLYSVNRENPESSTMLEAEYYTWDNGKITLNKASTDSLYVTFSNTALPNAVLRTGLFMVKTAEDFGKDTPVATLNFSNTVSNVTFGVGVAGATVSNPVKFNVDFGDGKPVEFTATSDGLPAAPNVSGARKGSIIVYMPEGKQITALGIKDQRMLNVDLSNASSLAQLAITGANLSAIDLQWNRCLQSMDLSNNNLTGTIDLSGANGGYGKNVLTHFDLSNNKLTELTTETNEIWIDVNLANNQFADFTLLKAKNLKRFNINNNLMETLDLRDCEVLEELYAANNKLTELLILDYVPLKKLDVSGNAFTFASLPPVGQIAEYTYAPQQEVFLPVKAPVVSLYDYLFTAEDGTNTKFEWHLASDNSVVTQGIRDNNGRFFFDNPNIGEVYCRMTHPAFPAFAGENAITTTKVETADMPTNVFATFTPANDGTGRISLAAKEKGTTVYIDWSGEGDFEQYILTDTYTIFEARTFAGLQAKCYSYDTDEGVKVFSLMGTPLLQADLSKMKNLINASFQNVTNGQETIAFPTESAGLEELSLYNCDITDLTSIIAKFPKLRMLTTPQNPFTSVDLSVAPLLESFQSGGGMLEKITLNNQSLWNLSVESNNLEEIDFANAPAIKQMWLSNNNIAKIDLSPLKDLGFLFLDGNRFTFETLPLRSNLSLYDYAPQQPMEISIANGRVDLSSQASVNGVPTEYTWFIDEPYLDENGDLQGENLYVDEEYTIENGVTSFLTTFKHIMCVMTNTTFPNLYLTTTYIDVGEAAGVENVAVDGTNASVTVHGNNIVVKAANGTPVTVYGINGVSIASATGSTTFGPLQTGIYIVKVGTQTVKVSVR